MKCQFCEQESSVTYTKIVGDKSQKIYLCAGCADENGITNLDNFNLSDILMSDEKHGLPEESERVHLSECSECGFTLDDLRKIGRLGCSSCYEIFATEVDGMISNMHKGVEHKGKVPEGMLRVIEAKTKLQSLQSKLEKAIAGEDYEMAGQLKEELELFKESLAKGTR